MLLLAHVTIAIVSLVFGAVAIINPSRRKLLTNLGLIAATLISGTFLVISTHSPMLQSCISGLTYVCVMTAMSAVSYRRLAKQEVSID
jgi:hypothetical protein